MNVYDFDFTIYHGDCMYDFILFCTRRHPTLLRFLPGQALGMLRHRASMHTVAERPYDVYHFLPAVPDLRAEIDAFWDGGIHKIYPYYRRQRRDDDVVASASPSFLLRPACRRLGIAGLVASDVDMRTGASIGQNCFGSEKALRFLAAHPNAAVDEFYSDDLRDAPMASLASRPFLVRGGTPRPWPGRG